MDYKEKYNEMVRRAKELHESGNALTRQQMEIVCPELTESEDERVRKELIKFFSSQIVKVIRGIPIKDILAYLEKQKEQKPELPKPHKGNDNNPYDMQVSEAQEYAINRGFGIPYNDGEVYINEGHMTQTIGNILRWADEHPKEQKSTEDLKEKRKKECPFRVKLDNNLYGCERYEDMACTCDGNCSWIVDYPKLKEIQDRKEQKPNIEICPHSIKSKSYKENGYPIENCDYGLEIALSILEKTLGKVQGYQTDDGIREHQTAIKAVKDVMKEQRPAEWNEDYREEDIQTRFAFYTYKDELGVLYLSNVFVEETSRNHGFGTRILKAAEKAAEAIGATTISLKVKQDSPANAWYRKHGYGYVAFEDGYDWLEKNLEYMKPNKQDWSEEDEKIANEIEEELWYPGDFPDYPSKEESELYDDCQRRLDWFKNRLKSLRPQPQWKPSEEQLKALQMVKDSHCFMYQQERMAIETLLKELTSL